MGIIKPKGIITFNPHANAPNFVLGTIAISLNQLKEWCEGEGKEWITDYKGEPQLKLQVTQMKEGRGILLAVDTYRPKSDGEKYVKEKEQFKNREVVKTTTRDGITTEDIDGLTFTLFAIIGLSSMLSMIAV